MTVSISAGTRAPAYATAMGRVPLVVLVLLSGCTAGPPTPAVLGPTVAPTVTPSPGSPAICTALAQSAAIVGVEPALRKLAVPETAGEGAATLRSAAGDLRALKGQAFDAQLEKAAAALEQVASAGIADRTAADRLSAALRELGSEVQGPCRFPS